MPNCQKTKQKLEPGKMEKNARAYRMENGSVAAGFAILPSSHPGRRCAPPARAARGSSWEELKGRGEDGGSPRFEVRRVTCFQLLLCLVKRACSSLVGLAATARRVRCALWCRGGGGGPDRARRRPCPPGIPRPRYKISKFFKTAISYLY
jgi:hypothetical protein